MLPRNSFYGSDKETFRVFITLYKKWGRTTMCSAPYNRPDLLWQFSGDPLSPPLHTNFDTAGKTKFREGIQIDLLQALSIGQNLVPLIVLDWSFEHIKAGEFASKHLRQGITDFLNERGIEILQAGSQFLTFHKAIEAQRAGVGIEIL